MEYSKIDRALLVTICSYYAFINDICMYESIVTIATNIDYQV